MDEITILNWLAGAMVLLFKLLVACGAIIFIVNALENPEAKRKRLVRERISQHQLDRKRVEEKIRVFTRSRIIGNRRIR